MIEFEKVSIASGGVDTIRRAYELKPDVIIADVNMPDIDLLSVVREIKNKLKNVRFLFIVGEENEELLTVISEIETVGVLPYKSHIDEFMNALKLVARGDNYLSASTVSGLRNLSPTMQEAVSDPLSKITYRERDVLYWLSHGYSNKEIAEKLILSEKTVKTHVSRILKKLDIPDRTKAAAIAWKDGLPLMSEEFFL